MIHKRVIFAGAAAFAAGLAGFSMFSHADEAPAAGAEALAAEAGDVSEKDMSYALGFQVGTDFAERDIAMDVESFSEGLAAALAGEASRLDEEALMQALFAFQLQMQAKQQARDQESIAANAAFLEQNKAEEGVQVTESGLQYKVIASGDADGASPEPTDTVTVHYRGRLIDGEEFDSSYKRGEPAAFPANRVIAGWTEALQMMKPGDHWQLYIPAELGYGAQGTPGGPIPPHATLIFDVELIDFTSGEE